jgi:hypothetical protein
MNKFEFGKHDVSKYIISILLLLVGGVAFFSYLAGLTGDGLESQPLGMFFAGLALISVGVIALPEVLDKLDAKKYKSILIAGVVVALGLGYGVVNSVSEEIEFQKTKVRVEGATIQQLKDIREIQLAHKSVRGTYAPDFDSLETFMNADVLPVTYNMGSFHDTLNDKRSAELGYIIKRSDIDSLAAESEMSSDELLMLIQEDNSVYKVRDTLYTNFYAENLTPEARASQKLPAFDIKDMPFNPRTGERFVMSTSAVEVGGLWQSTILVQDPTPFGREKVKKDTLRFGSLTEAHTDGNWRN